MNVVYVTNIDTSKIVLALSIAHGIEKRQKQFRIFCYESISVGQDPYKKYTFTTKTRVSVVLIEQMRAHLKGFSARIILSSESIVTCASGLLPNPVKVPYFQYRAWWYSIVRKFYNDVEKFQESQFWDYALHCLWPWSGQSPKNSK
jgi:hypothetical protein